MRTIDKIFEEMKEIADGQRWEEVEPFLTGCLDEAREEENYGIYIGTGNELLRFYRETEQFKKALDLSEDLLLLMEELQLDETEHFATVMLNVAAACQAAGRAEEARRYYVRALKILESKPETEEVRADIFTQMALLFMNQDNYEEGEAMLKQALPLYEQLADVQETDREREMNRHIHYSTVLSGLGEASYRRKDYADALSYYEKAAALSQKCFGESEGTRLLRENCASIARQLGDEEKSAYYIGLNRKEEPLP